MSCKSIQVLLANGEPLNATQQSHADSCPDCIAFLARAQRLSHELELARQISLPSQLQSQIASRLATRGSNPMKSFSFKPIAVSAGVVALIGIPLVFAVAQRQNSRLPVLKGVPQGYSVIRKWADDKGNLRVVAEEYNTPTMHRARYYSEDNKDSATDPFSLASAVGPFKGDKTPTARLTGDLTVKRTDRGLFQRELAMQTAVVQFVGEEKPFIAVGQGLRVDVGPDFDAKGDAKAERRVLETRTGTFKATEPVSSSFSSNAQVWTKADRMPDCFTNNVDELARRYLSGPIRREWVDGDLSTKGMRIRALVLTNMARNSRLECLMDADQPTVPHEVRKQYLDKSGWHTTGILQFDYSKPDPAVFTKDSDEDRQVVLEVQGRLQEAVDRQTVQLRLSTKQPAKK